MRKLLPLGLFLVILVLLVYFTVLQKKKEIIPPPAVPADYVQPLEKVTESEGTLPEGFPDIPLYPSLAVDKAYKKELDGRTDYVAVWFYDGDIDEIMEWYVGELIKSGWNVDGPIVTEGEDDLEIDAENSMYKLKILNTERSEGETGRAGKLLMAEINQK